MPKKPSAQTIAVAALAMSSTLAVAAPASAAVTSCRTTMSGGLVGQQVIASSADVYAEAVAGPQRVAIDQVAVNYFGQKRYRLASPVQLVTAQGPTGVRFSGGKGYYVSEQSLRITSAFSTCLRSLPA